MEQRMFEFVYSSKVKLNLLKLIRCWWCKRCIANLAGCSSCIKNIDDPYQQPSRFEKKI